MSAEGEDSEPTPLELALAQEASAIAKRYRIDEATALAAVSATLRDPAMARAVEAEVARGDRRGAALKRLAKAARRQVYHDLRRYTADEEAQERLREALTESIARADDDAVGENVERLLQSHVSTRERMPSYAAFAELVDRAVPNPRSVVDLGSGLHPLWVFEHGAAHPEVYLAIDRDRRAMGILEAYAAWPRGSRLIAQHADLEQIDWHEELARAQVESFDLALLLKLVAVVRRRQPGALERLATVPSRTLVITGSKEALTRRQDISRREDAVLRQFIDRLSPSSVEREETEDEIVYVVRR